jgi:hypothetical protein
MQENITNTQEDYTKVESECIRLIGGLVLRADASFNDYLLADISIIGRQTEGRVSRKQVESVIRTVASNDVLKNTANKHLVNIDPVRIHNRVFDGLWTLRVGGLIDWTLKGAILTDHGICTLGSLILSEELEN